MNAYRFGIIAEYLVAFLYLIRFYRILGHRIKNYMGEVDLVAVRGSTIVFIEVKARMAEYDDVLCKMSQQKRIRNAATIFLQKNSKYNGYDIRFDLCVVRPYRFPQIIENVW